VEIVASKKKTGGEVELTWDDYKKMEFTHCVSVTYTINKLGFYLSVLL